MTLANIKIGDKLLWQHRLADEFKDEAKSPEQLQRIISVKAIIDNYIKTDFGDYFIHNGFNMDAPCGCNRFCNCYGKVSLLIDNA
ncbi:MAG: hypothetical protein WAX77_02730 [Methylococcaceae bacterium]